jgi:hypothetical protein
VTKKRPRFLLVTDCKDVSALDTKADEPLHTTFAKLDDSYGFFLPLAGFDRYDAVKENSAEIKAAGRLSRLDVEIVSHNPGWTTAAKRHALGRRIVYAVADLDACLMANQRR